MSVQNNVTGKDHTMCQIISVSIPTEATANILLVNTVLTQLDVRSCHFQLVN